MVDDFQSLPWSGRRVSQIVVDYQLTLVLDGDAQLVIETEALLGDDRLDPARQDVAPALTLLSMAVRSGVAMESGELRLDFADGRALTVVPHPEWEAWNLVGPAALRIVCLPGGGLAVWG